MVAPTFGVVPDSAQPEPAGFATIIPDASPSIAPIDMLITGWSSPIHTIESQAGTERLEDGAVITDHVVAMPDKLTMTGWVSNLSQDGNAPAEAWEGIRELQRKEDVFKVVTEWAVYDEMFIIGATTTQTGRGMKFTIDLQQVVRVGLQQGSTRPTRTGPPIETSGPEVDQGKVSLVESIPGTDLGGGRFLTGLPGDPNRRVVVRNPDGTLGLEPASDTDEE